MKKKVIILAAAAILVVGGAVLFLHSRGDAGEESGDKEIKALYEYELSGVEFTALPIIDESVKVYQVKKDTVETEDSDVETVKIEDEKSVTETEDAVTYRYEGLTDAGSLAGAYTMMMTTQDLGFSFVDDGLFKVDAPDFETESGAVRIARRAPIEGKVMSICLEWMPGSCIVTLDTPEGEVAAQPAPDTLSVAETIEYVRALPPIALGLEGDSMDAYNIYAQDSIVLVDGIPCLRLNVYSDTGKAGTNEIEGNYLIAAYQNHIYLVDPETGALREVQ